MSLTKSPRFGLTRSDSPADSPSRVNKELDNRQLEFLGVVWRAGDDSAKGSASSASNVRSLYHATDTGILYWSNGVNWVTLYLQGLAADIQALRTGFEASPGSVATSGGVMSAKFALASHIHPMGVPSAPPSIGTVNAPGTVYGRVFAASDHVHRLANGSIDSATLFGQSVVSTDSLPDLVITTDKLVNNLLTTSTMTDSLVIESKLANSAITTEKIANSSAASEKINNLAVTSDKVGALQVVELDLASSSVTGLKLAPGSVTSVNIPFGVTINQAILSNPTITPGSTAINYVIPVQLQAPIVKTKRRQYSSIAFAGGLSTVVNARWRIPLFGQAGTLIPLALNGFNFTTIISWNNAPSSVIGWDLDVSTQTIIGSGQGFSLQIRGGMGRPFNLLLVNGTSVSVQWQNGPLPPLRTDDPSNVVNFQIIKTGEPNTFQAFGSWDTLFMDTFDNLFLQDFYR